MIEDENKNNPDKPPKGIIGGDVNIRNTSSDFDS